MVKTLDIDDFINKSNATTERYLKILRENKYIGYVGAMIREAEHSESKADFVHKIAIAQKEINETIYWLELLCATEYLSQQQFDSLNADAVEIIKLITSIIKTAKLTLNH